MDEAFNSFFYYYFQDLAKLITKFMDTDDALVARPAKTWRISNSTVIIKVIFWTATQFQVNEIKGWGLDLIKGQLISKCLFGVIVSTKIATKIL